MAINSRSLVMAVFTDDTQAQQAMNDLQNAGFSNDQIRYSARRGGGGIADSLHDMGLSGNEADFYNSEFEAGRTIVSVNTRDRQQEAYSILTRDGGYDFNMRNSQMGGYNTGAQTDTGYSRGTTDTGYTGGSQADYSTDEGRRMRLREEQLTADKQQVQAGEVRLRKDVKEEQQSFEVPVTHEEVYIQQRPGSGQATDEAIGEGETFDVPVSQEQVNVNKQTVDRGEVGIGKRQVTENRRVSDTVRREEARVEREGDVNVQGADPNTTGQ
jgi:uncharacterized protein (TIGR02271 family)